MSNFKMLTITVAATENGEELIISVVQSHAFKKVAKKKGTLYVEHVLKNIAKKIQIALLECAK
jgi:hypothetical protein